MSWQTGSSSVGYQDLLDRLVNFAVGNSVQSAAINSGGTGYTVGDTLTVAGGTFTYAATLEVLAVSVGVITSVRVKTAGLYSANPSNPASVTGGTGTTATFNLTIAGNGWTAVRRTQQAASATVGAGGSGYSVGNILTVVGGNLTTAATFTVATLGGGGAVATVTLTTAGNYRDVPTSPVATTGGAGSGATLNVTWTPITGSVEREVILLGTGAGSDSIYVGLKSYQQVNGPDTAFNWTLEAMTGFNSNLAFESQAGVSPGGVPASTGGAYVPLHNSGGSFPISFWFSVTPRRIVMVAKIQNAIVTSYASCYLGFLNPYGTTSEFPYPVYVCGSTSRHDCLFNTTSPSITGLTEMVGISAKTGPGYIRWVDNTWHSVKNSIAIDTGSPSRAVDRTNVVYPCGQTNTAALAIADQIVDDAAFNWDDVIPASGIPGTATYRLQPTPNTGGDLYLLVPATITLTETISIQDVWGEIDDVFWLSGSGGVSSEDLVKSGSDRYRIFQNGNRTTEFSFMAILEN